MTLKEKEIKTKYQQLTDALTEPSTFNDPKKIASIAKEQAELKPAYDLICELEKTEKQLTEAEKLRQTEKDPALIELATNDIENLTAKIQTLKNKLNQELNPKNPLDKKNAIIEIRAGTGGDESSLFAADLFKMYARYAENKNWKINILNSNQTSLGGFKEIIFECKGEGAYGELKYEGGTHRVQRVPETEKAGRIHTSAVTVVVLPEAEEIDIEIKPSDIRIDTFCSSGPGGQSVNTTYSAIRILHLPTGMIVSCQDQKSQHQNKEKALQVLRSRLLAKAEEERRLNQSAARKEMVGSGDRSDKIRTYNFPQDRVTDHRINQSWHNLNNILDGELENIIKALKEIDRQ